MCVDRKGIGSCLSDDERPSGYVAGLRNGGIKAGDLLAICWRRDMTERKEELRSCYAVVVWQS